MKNFLSANLYIHGLVFIGFRAGLSCLQQVKKPSNWSAVNLKKACELSQALNLALRYGQVNMVSDYLALRGVN